ncbi:MAG TPA: hypothetical protein IAA18_08265 [Candidatus Pseudomonas excrementavium]|nr:hypothetical protein [Candidatus Pseudomonas excrementavium]
MMKQHQEDQIEPFFISEEVQAELIAAGHEFDPPPIACVGRLRDVLEGMSDDELESQPGEIADLERERRQSKPFSAG